MVHGWCWGIVHMSAILKEHPELCQMEAYLIEHFTNVPVEQTARLAKDIAGLRFCMFRVGKERV